MGFLDKLLGRRKKDDAAEGMQTTPQPTSMPTDDLPEHTHGQGEHSHEPEEKPPGGSAS
jgi:hypothetical protein